MRNQLLEDVGDSASQPAPIRRADAPAPAAAPRPQVWRERTAPPRTVWRAREPAPPEAATPPTSSGSPYPSFAPWPGPGPGPGPAPLPPPAAALPDDRFSFSSQAPDLAIAQLDTAPAWSERWGRKAAGWGAATVLLGLVAAAGAWMYQDSQVVTVLALVADQSPPAMPQQAPAPWVEAERVSPPPPPLVMAPVLAAPAPDPPPVPGDQTAPAPAEDHGEQAAREAAETVRRAEARRAAARKEAARKEAARKGAAQKEAKQKDVAKAEAARRAAARKEAARTAAAADPPTDPAALQAETLRQCRAAGYHASQCVRRGCVATRFGLACRG